jgi:hypothetical protein
LLEQQRQQSLKGEQAATCCHLSPQCRGWVKGSWLRLPLHHTTPPSSQPAHPAAATAAAPACRYVLVKADTLEAPTDSVLRSARRQLGEPSDSRAGADGQPTPASAARSRPLPPAAEAAAAAAGAGFTAAAAAAAAPAPLPNSAMLAAMAKQLAKTVSEDGFPRQPPGP